MVGSAKLERTRYNFNAESKDMLHLPEPDVLKSDWRVTTTSLDFLICISNLINLSGYL